MNNEEYLNNKEDKRDISQKIIDIKRLIISTTESIIDRLNNELHFEPIDELILTRTKHGENSVQLEVQADRISSLSINKGSLLMKYVNFVNNVILDTLPLTELYKIAECIADHYSEYNIKVIIEKADKDAYIVTLDWSGLNDES